MYFVQTLVAVRSGVMDCPRNHPLKWAKNSMTSHDKGKHEDVEEEVEEQDDEADEDDIVVFIIVIIINIIIIITKINP